MAGSENVRYKGFKEVRAFVCVQVRGDLVNGHWRRKQDDHLFREPFTDILSPHFVAILVHDTNMVCASLNLP